MNVVVPVILALAGASASANVFVIDAASRSLEASSQLVGPSLGPGGLDLILDPDSAIEAALVSGPWAPPVVGADSAAVLQGITGATSDASITHTSDVSAQKIEGSTSMSVEALVERGFPGFGVAQGQEAFSVTFTLASPTTVELSNDATINSVVDSPQVSGQAVLSLAGNTVLSLPLFEDGSVQAQLQPGTYSFSATSLVVAKTFPLLNGAAAFDGSYDFSLTPLVPIPEVEHFGIGAAAALLGFGIWRRRRTRA